MALATTGGLTFHHPAAFWAGMADMATSRAGWRSTFAKLSPAHVGLHDNKQVILIEQGQVGKANAQ